MTSNLTRTQYDELLHLIIERVGIIPNNHQVDELQQVLAKLLPSLRSLNRLKAKLIAESLESALWQDILQILTIGETYFFRNQDQFNALRNHVLPAIIEKHRTSGNMQLRIWSAGCASGEEAYSLAILLRELIPDLSSWSISVLGTDINASSLDRARRGMYRAWSFRNETPEYLRDRWFELQGDSFIIDPTLKRGVIFDLLNFVNDDYPSISSGTSQIDLILFRNVSIYFDQPTTETIIKRLCGALTDDGWLVVGHAEPLPSTFQGLTIRNFLNTTLYQKSPVVDQTKIPPWTFPEPRNLPTKSIVQGTVLATPPLQPIPVVPQLTSWQRAKNAADQENWDEAMKYLAMAERENKFQPEVHYLRALIQLQRENSDAALSSLRRALFYDPKFALAHYTLGEIYEKQKAYEEAAHSWQHARKAVSALDPQDHIPYSEEITVEMLLGLLDHRLNLLPTSTLGN